MHAVARSGQVALGSHSRKLRVSVSASGAKFTAQRCASGSSADLHVMDELQRAQPPPGRALTTAVGGFPDELRLLPEPSAVKWSDNGRGICTWGTASGTTCNKRMSSQCISTHECQSKLPKKHGVRSRGRFGRIVRTLRIRCQMADGEFRSMFLQRDLRVGRCVAAEVSGPFPSVIDWRRRRRRPARRRS